MNEASGRLGRARFLRLGWFRVPAPAASYGPPKFAATAKARIRFTSNARTRL